MQDADPVLFRENPAADHRQTDPQALLTILDNVDALIYVADMDTHELLFMNDYGRRVWGEPAGRKCWAVLQGRDGPCPFCTNHRLVDGQGEPTEPLVWEFRNEANGRWYQCRDQAMRWPDGRLVRLEIATDITERREMEEALRAERERADALAREDELTGLNNRRAFVSASASFGVASLIAADDGIDDLMARADRALYRAKQAGRDCVYG